MTPLRVEIAAWTKGVAWLGIGFFGFCAIASWKVSFPFWFLFLFFVGLGVFHLLVLGPIEMSDTFIRHTTPLNGRCEMNWDEIEKIELAPFYAQSRDAAQVTEIVEMTDIVPEQQGDIVLHGKGKRLAIPGIHFWSGQDKEQMIQLFKTQIEKRAIKMEVTYRAKWQMSKGTRVKR